MPRTKRTILAFVIALTLGACGDPPTKSGGGGGNNGSNIGLNNLGGNNGGGSGIENVDEMLWDLLCEAAFECPDTNPQFVSILSRYGSETACKGAETPGFLEIDTDRLAESVESGRLNYDSASASRCLQAVREDLCAGLGFENVSECDDIVTGNVAEGGNCLSSEECTGGLSCNTGATGECYGICEPNCGEQTCTDTQFCNGSECVARRAAGDSCDFDQCQGDLYCRDGQCTSGRDVSEGGACNRPRDCEDGLQCLGGTCRKLVVKQQGQPCEISDSLSEICAAGMVCTQLRVEEQAVVGTCGPPQREGQPCRLYIECAADLTCDTMSPLEEGTCVPLYSSGEQCMQDFDCASGNCADGTCEARTTEEVCTVP